MIKWLLFFFLTFVAFGQDSTKVDLDSWKKSGRKAAMEFFSTEVYGVVPAGEIRSDWKLDRESEVLDGRVVRREYVLTLGGSLNARVLAYVPKGAKNVPAFLGLNFGGNHTVDADEWVTSGGDDKPGKAAKRWPVDMITKAGFAVLTVHCDDFDPDKDDQFQNGVHALFKEKRTNESWGTIAGWAWGLSRVLDQLKNVEEIDDTKVAVIGHSRLGKTALWAGASDERFAMVISNNSGCGGAALSKRRQGETVAKINTTFPHWFAGNFKQYNDKEDELPYDQDGLIACIAPRPVYVASASKDRWADPEGEFLALKGASVIYRLFDQQGVAGKDFPNPGETLKGTGQWYHLREGRHEITPWDWERYLEAALVLKKE